MLRVEMPWNQEDSHYTLKQLNSLWGVLYRLIHMAKELLLLCKLHHFWSSLD